jgi:TRAP-type C4-dicarboxylate transport system permease small subunit
VRQLERIVGTVTGGLAFLGGLVILLAMGLLTAVDVVLRQLGLGIPGSWEMVTFAMRWMIGLSLPYAFWAGRHVAVEAFVALFPPRGRLAFVVFAEILGLIAMGLMTWRLTIRGMDILGRGVRTTDLGILTFHHWLPLILGCALSFVVLLILCLRDGLDLAGLRRGDRPA